MDTLINFLLNNLKPPCVKEKAYKSFLIYILYVLYSISFFPVLILVIMLVDKSIFSFNLKPLKEIVDFINEYRLWFIFGALIVITLYIVVRKFIFCINIQGQWDDDGYIKYLKKTWIKYFSQEKDKKLIFIFLKKFCGDHALLIPNWQGFYNCDKLDQTHKEYLIKTLFDLLECCVERGNKVAVDHIITQLQNLFDKNKLFITEWIENEWDQTYIQQNRNKLKRIYDQCVLNSSYEANEFYVRFYNKCISEVGSPSYNDFILNKKFDLSRKLRIIWLIYESDSASRGDILQKIKILPGVHPKIIDFINVLLEEKKIPQNTSSKTTIVEKNPTTGDMPND